MSEAKKQKIERRRMLATIAAAAVGAPLSTEAAQHVHNAASEDRKATGGVYKPKGLSANEYKTLDTLCELIMPGARQAGAAEFIDVLCNGSKQMAAIYTGGLAWINSEMRRRYDSDFVSAKPEQQTALLDVIAYRKNRSPELNAGIQFFDWARRMTVDAYFTSKVGIASLGFKGNGAVSEFQVPVESLNHALKRSPVG